MGSIPIRCNSDSNSKRFDAVPSPIPSQMRFDFIPIGFNSVPILFPIPIPIRFDSDSVSDSIPIRFDSDSVPIRFNSDAIRPDADSDSIRFASDSDSDSDSIRSDSDPVRF